MTDRVLLRLQSAFRSFMQVAEKPSSVVGHRTDNFAGALVLFMIAVRTASYSRKSLIL